MKNRGMFLLLFLFSISTYAQSTDSLLTKKDIFKSLGLVDMQPNKDTFNFYNVDLLKNELLFSSYNETTKLNDSYLINNEEYVYTKSCLLFENNFRNLKIDSYNPYGVSNVKSALILGAVGEFLNKLQK